MNSDSEEEKRQKPSCLRLLVHWLSAEEFFSIARQYYPEHGRAPIGNKETDIKFLIQKSVVLSLKKYMNHPETFIALRKFCIGDFLKVSIGSLVKICLNISQNRCIEFLNECMDTPVSFKKHIIRLQIDINNKEKTAQLLDKLWSSEENPSLRKIILENVFGLFIADPNQNMWSVLNTCIHGLTHSDQHSIEVVFRFSKIPDEYLTCYIEHCWSIIEKLKEKSPELVDYKHNIINAIENRITLISFHLIEIILSADLFQIKKNTSTLHSSFCSLAAKYILWGKINRTQLKRINFVLLIMKTAFDGYWNHFEGDDQPSYKTRQQIKQFVRNICEISFAEQKNFRQIYSVIDMQHNLPNLQH